jgi:hypothetical protein
MNELMKDSRVKTEDKIVGWNVTHKNKNDKQG